MENTAFKLVYIYFLVHRVKTAVTLMSRGTNLPGTDLLLLADLVISLDSGIRADAVVEHKVPQHPRPGGVLRQGVVIFRGNFLHLKTEQQSKDQ